MATLGDLIDALVQAARGKDFSMASWRRGVSAFLQGSAAEDLDPRRKRSYYALFQLPPNNAHKYLRGGRDSRGLSYERVTRIHDVLFDLGFVTGLRRPKPEDELDGWGQYIELAIGAVRRHSSAAVIVAESDQEEHRQGWRIIPNERAVQLALSKLDTVGIVAIVGISGAGKSVACQQVYAALSSAAKNVIYFDARRWLGSALEATQHPTEQDYAALCASILAVLAERSYGQPIATRRRQAFAQEIAAFRRRLQESTAARGLSQEDRRSRERYLRALGRTPVHWETFLRATASYARDILSFTHLQEVATLLGLGVADATLIIDDVWNFRAARFVIDPLFQRVQSAAPASGPRLLVASQQASCLAFFSNHATIDIDQVTEAAQPDETNFGRLVLAAWAAQPDPESRFSSETSYRRIAAFERNKMSKPAAQLCRIDEVIGQVGSNPLALAVIGAAWRVSRYDPNFWSEIIRALQRKPSSTLRLHPQAGPDQIEYRHENVLASLQFSWRLLPEQIRERYLDLVVSPVDEPINEHLFKVLWRRFPRGDDGELPSLTLLALAENSLLKRLYGSPSLFRLHDLHRKLIVSELALRGPDAVVDKHRDLLAACNLLKSDGTPNRKIRFRESTRYRLLEMRLKLNSDASEEETQEISRYMLYHLYRHFSEAGVKYRSEQERVSRFDMNMLNARLADMSPIMAARRRGEDT